jgi:hypothetical protein
MDLFAARTSISEESRRRIREWVLASFPLTPDDTVLVTELRCHEPDCPPVETVIGVLRPGHDARQYKIGKAPPDVLYEDVAVLAHRDH